MPSKRIMTMLIILILLVLPITGCLDYEKISETAEVAILNPYKSVIYQIVTDRFYDGDPTNNESFYNPNSFYVYHGRDFKGVIEKLDYLKELGVSAIWISPPFDNINNIAGNVASYHGYWLRDYFVPEEHFGSWQDFITLL